MHYKKTIACALVCATAISTAAHATETLEQAWAEAYSRNPSLQAERAELRATDEQVAQALSNWRPSVDGTANVGRTWQKIPAFDVFGNGNFASETHGVGAQVTQPVFRGFRTIEETEVAEQQVLAGRAKLQHAEQQLFIDTATAFFSVLRDQDILIAQREDEKVLEDKLKETRVRNEHGDLTLTDVRQAEARLSRAQINRFQTESNLTADRASFQRLVGHLPETLDNGVFNLDIPKNLEQALEKTHYNPDVVEAEHNVEQAKAQIKDNEGSLLPEVNIVGNTSRNWGQSSTVPGREDSSQILLQATVPLYRNGADYSKARASQQTLTQREMELDEAQHKAFETATNAWQMLTAASASLYADQDQVNADKEALKGVQIENKVGTRTMLDVLNAEQELLDARIELAKSLHDRNLALVQIKAAVGELTADRLTLKTPLYNPQQHYKDVKWKWIGFSKDNSNYMVPSR